MLVLLAVVSWLATPTAAGAWEFIDAMNVYGDQATGIVQAARNDPDTALGVGCQGDRWRIAVIAPRNEKGLDLGPDPSDQVSFAFDPKLPPAGKWQVRKRPSGQAMLLAPEPTAFVRHLVGAEEKNADAVLYVGVKARKGKQVLEFPLAGLRAAIRKDLWKPCKLENYIPEPAGE